MMKTRITKVASITYIACFLIFVNTIIGYAQETEQKSQAKSENEFIGTIAKEPLAIYERGGWNRAELKLSEFPDRIFYCTFSDAVNWGLIEKLPFGFASNKNSKGWKVKLTTRGPNDLNIISFEKLVGN